jgi:Protein of unknown function (DUF3800)
MLVAIDESGDTGKRFNRGSSPWFILAAIIVDQDTGLDISKQILEFTISRGLDEVHYAHDSEQIKHEFLSLAKTWNFNFQVLAIDKKKLLRQKPHALISKSALYNYVLSELHRTTSNSIAHPKILIDSSGNAVFEWSLRRQIGKLWGCVHKGDTYCISGFLSVNSKDQPLVQLADYVAGSARHYVENYTDKYYFADYIADKGVIHYEN